MVNQGDASTDNQFILRRIDNGLSKELKTISNIKEIENPPTGFVIGYRTNTPYSVQIEIIDIKIKVSISVNSRPFLFLFEATDESFKIGQIGFGTYHCKASFISIELRPPTFIASGAIAEDFLKNSSDEILMNPYQMTSDESKGEESSGGSGNLNGNSFKNQNEAPWKACVKKTTSSSRVIYCDERFKNEYQKQKCKVNKIFKKASFCDTCCKSNIFWVHTNILHNCKKQCYRNTEETNTDSNYKNLCMMSDNPDKNIYSYCQNKFLNKLSIRTCKYDMCNLCCVNLNTLKQKKHAFETVKSCFNDCSKKFYKIKTPI